MCGICSLYAAAVTKSTFGAARDFLAVALEQDPTRPLLTFYDDASSERVELSVATFANWVAKTANFLRDGIGAEAGQRLGIQLPTHWQSAVWLSASWAVGTTPVVGAAGAAADVATDIAVLAADELGADASQRLPSAVELVVLGLGPFGLPRPGPPSIAVPPGAIDYDREIHSHGDHFAASVTSAGSPQEIALELDGEKLSTSDLAAAATRALETWQLQPGDRVLGVNPLDTLPAILAMLVVPLIGGVGAVLCRHLDLSRLPERLVSERVVGLLPAPELHGELSAGSRPPYLSDLGRS